MTAFDKVSKIDLNLANFDIVGLDLPGAESIIPSDLVTGLGGLVNISKSISRYFEIYESKNLTTIDGLSNVIRHNIPASRSPLSLKADTFSCRTEVTETHVHLYLEITAVSLTTNTSFQGIFTKLLAETGSMSNLWDILDRLNPHMSLDVPQLDFFFEATARIGIEIVVSRSGGEDPSVFVTDYEGGIQVLVDPIDADLGGLLQIHGGLISLSFGVRGAPGRSVSVGNDTMASIKKGLRPTRYSKLDVVLPIMTDQERYIPVVAAHDLDLFDGVFPELNVDLDLSFLSSSNSSSKNNHLAAAAQFLNNLLGEISDQTPFVSTSYGNSLSSFLGKLKGTTVDFHEVFIRYIDMHDAYKQIGNNLSGDLKPNLNRAKQLLQNEVFLRNVLQKLQQAKPIFERFDITSGIDLATNEKFGVLDYIPDILEVVFDVAGASETVGVYGIKDVEILLSLTSKYALSKKNAIAFLDILPHDISNGFDRVSFDLPRGADGRDFSPSDYLTELFDVLDINSTDVTLLELGKFLESLPDTNGASDEFQRHTLTLLKESYPILFGGFDSQILADPNTGMPFDWRHYLTEVGLALKSNVRRERDVGLLFGYNPTLGGFLGFLTNHFEFSSAYQSSVGGAKFVGKIDQILGEKHMIMQLDLHFDIAMTNSHNITIPALTEGLKGTGLEGFIPGRIASTLDDIIPGIDVDFGATLSISIEVGMNIQKLLESYNAGRPSLVMTVSNMTLVGFFEASDLTTKLSISPTSDYTFSIRESAINLGFGIQTNATVDDPIVVLDEDRNIAFSITDLISSLNLFGSVDAVLPIVVPVIQDHPIVFGVSFEIGTGIEGMVSIKSASYPISFEIQNSITTMTFNASNKIHSFPLPMSAGTYTEDGLESLLEYLKSGSGASCPYSLMNGNFQSTPVMNFFSDSTEMIPINFKRLIIDACSYGITLEASIDKVIHINNFNMNEFYFLLSANRSEWMGEVVAETDLFDVSCHSSLTLGSTWGMNDATLSCAVNKDAYSLQANISLTDKRCSEENFGAVEFVHYASNFEGNGIIRQLPECDSNNNPKWTALATTTADFDTSFWGLQVRDAVVQLNSSVDNNNATNWFGHLSGGVEFGDSGSILSADIEFEGLQIAIKKFSMNGAATIGPVTGQFDVLYNRKMGMLEGAADIVVQLDNADIGGTLDVQISHVCTYNENNQEKALWSINGTADRSNIWGIELEQFEVNMTGRLANSSTLWSGTISGTSRFLDSAEVSIEADIANSELSNLRADLFIANNGLQFSGVMDIAPDYANNFCAKISAEGEVQFLSHPNTFTSTLYINNCAFGDQVLYQIEATTPSLSYNGLVFDSSVRGVLTATRADVNKYSGTLTSTFFLLDAQVTGNIKVVDNTLREVRASVQFTTDDGLLTSDLDFEYKPCGSAVAGLSTGSGQVIIQPPGYSGGLKVEGTLTYDDCKGDLTLEGNVDANGWGNGSNVFSNVNVLAKGYQLSNFHDSGRWEVTVTPLNGAGSVTFKNGDISLVTKYTSHYLNITVRRDTADCSGSGTATIKNLPHGIPPFQFGVNFTRTVCSSPDYRVVGFFKNLVIPVGSKQLSINDITVTVDVFKSNRTSVVTLEGLMQSKYKARLSFTVTEPTPGSGGFHRLGDINLVGDMKEVGSKLSDVAKSFSSSVGDSLGIGHPDLFNSMTTVSFGGVLVVVDFSQSLITVSGETTIFGMPVEVDIFLGVGTSGNSWNVALQLKSIDHTVRTGVPEIIEKAIDMMKPQGLSFSLSTGTFTANGINIRKGLSLRAQLGSDSQRVNDVLSMAPSTFADQINDQKDQQGGLIVMADIFSKTDIDIFISLKGDIPMNDDVSFKEVALCFRLTKLSFTVGFLAKINFAVGDSSSGRQEFEVTGFIGLGTGGIDVELSITSSKPWDRPLGIPGTQILFPVAVGIGFGVIPAAPFLSIKRFVIHGGVQVGGARGILTLGADLNDFSKTAFKASLTNLNLKKMISEVSGCSQCVEGPGNVLMDSSMESFNASFNPNPVAPVTIRAADFSESLDPGISVHVRKLNILSVIKIDSFDFELDASGMEASLNLEKVSWGPLSITSVTDHLTGPSCELVLRPNERRFTLNGRVQLLKIIDASINLDLGSDPMVAAVSFRFGSFEIQASITVSGKPGTPSFRNTFVGAFGTDLQNRLSTESGETTETELNTKHNEKAKQLENQKIAAEKKKKAAEDEQRAKLKQKQKEVDVARSDKDKKEKEYGGKSCSTKKCKWYDVPCVAKNAWCKTVNFFKNVWKAAVSVLRRIEDEFNKLKRALADVIDRAVDFFKQALDVLESFKDKLKQLGQMFLDFVSNLLKIHFIEFKAVLTSGSTEISIRGDITVVGHRFNFDYTLADFSYKAILDVLKGKAKSKIDNLIGF
eukprot:TRINITY_DN1679_c2_g1_i4.p1 TRINITY_DN1679_c2_g1~~TRINITY_DN1679_c2_g1_i4.p1  ORF type:complete len:2393 (+),score=463.18 TRINITY_DN1679_c2_g1_i4:1588-8766(+)